MSSGKEILIKSILFETEERAQKILDEKFPGLTVKVFENSDCEVRDKDGHLVLSLTCEANALTFTERFDQAMKELFK